MAFVAIVLTAARAVAQDEAAAAALFDRGLADMQAGHYDTGCPALGDSYRLDPRPGSLFTWAECEAKWGKLASALIHYTDYLGRVARMPIDQRAAQGVRQEVATKQVEVLKPLVPRLTLRLADAPVGTKILRDGNDLGLGSLDVPLPLDPGDHTIAVVIPSGERSEQQVHIDKGESKTVTLTLPAPVVAPPVTHVAIPTPEAPVREAPPPASRRGWAVAFAIVGGVGIATGLVTGSFALGEKGDIDANCQGTVCNATGKHAADTAQALALTSTIAFIGGAALGVVGIVLFATEPSHKRSARLTVQPLARGAFVGALATF